MRLVVIDAKAHLYSLFEGETLLAKLEATDLLDAKEVELVRIAKLKNFRYLLRSR